MGGVEGSEKKWNCQQLPKFLTDGNLYNVRIADSFSITTQRSFPQVTCYFMKEILLVFFI